jgi:hypothetical protein
MKKNNFSCILKVNEESSRIQSWIRIHKSEVRIRIRTKISRIPNTERNYSVVSVFTGEPHEECDDVCAGGGRGGSSRRGGAAGGALS